MSEYSIVPLTPGLCHKVDQLAESVYKRRFKNFHLRKYFNVSDADSAIGILALRNGEALAFTGLVPVKASITGKTISAGQNCDLLVSSSFRGKGIAQSLLEESLRMASEKKLHFTFGFTHSAVDRWLRPLGFERLGSFERFTFPFDDGLARKISRKLKAILSISESSEINNQMIKDGFDGLIYDETFKRSKIKRGTAIYRDGKCSAWLSSNRSYIGAVMGDCGAVELSAALDRRFSPRELTYMCSENTPLCREFERTWQRKDSMHIMTKNITGVYNLGNLRFQMADADFF